VPAVPGYAVLCCVTSASGQARPVRPGQVKARPYVPVPGQRTGGQSQADCAADCVMIHRLRCFQARPGHVCAVLRRYVRGAARGGASWRSSHHDATTRFMASWWLCHHGVATAPGLSHYYRLSVSSAAPYVCRILAGITFPWLQHFSRAAPWSSRGGTFGKCKLPLRIRELQSATNQPTKFQLVSAISIIGPMGRSPGRDNNIWNRCRCQLSTTVSAVRLSGFANAVVTQTRHTCLARWEQWE
jgi:hypothetical protein